MLELESVTLAYGAVTAVSEASLRVAQGETVALLGANGAGKTTILRAISRLMTPRSGIIRFEGRDMAGLTPDKAVRLGLAHCPEGRQVLARQGVRDNLELGAYVRSDRAGVRQDLEMVFDLFPRLRERAGQLAGTLSGGEQQMLAMGRALMSRPRLLLLDEPSLGLAPLITQEIFSIITGLNRQGVTILLVEQNAHMALKVAHRGYVLDAGRIIAEDEAKALAGDERVRKAYLG